MFLRNCDQRGVIVQSDTIMYNAAVSARVKGGQWSPLLDAMAQGRV